MATSTSPAETELASASRVPFPTGQKGFASLPNQVCEFTEAGSEP